MRVAGLEGIRRGCRTLTTPPSAAPDHRPDLVERDFTALGPNQLWVAEIIYVRIPTGFCYTALVTEVYTRRIVGWAVAASLHNEVLPLQAIEHALLSTRAEAASIGLVQRSDRGSPVLLAYSDALITTGVKASVGNVGDSYDNGLRGQPMASTRPYSSIATAPGRP
ncbi:hypothetical protein CIK66_01605 [Brachybacterium alimentarium]|uniref:Integrase catalytic domain-containing protein n=1 Tax=Brachybacterium alimentarium TaxID=47845 RepID=A0A2A3YNT1_9MICO|nr:hypothetical protein CIK66_01605 [Brachybacterium alimentarium]